MLQSRVTWGHGSFLLNGHFNTDGTIDRTKVQNTYVLDNRSFDPAFRDTRDPYHLSQGGALGRVHKGMAFLPLRGRILVPNTSQQSSLTDKELALRAAFDPYLCYLDSVATEGAYTLDWDELTADVTNFPSGRMPLRLYARPVATPRVQEGISDGPTRAFSLALVAGDPRRYRQVQSTLVLSPGTPSGSVANIGNVPAPLKATIVMAGAGSATFTITRSGVAFILDLSGMVNTDTVVVVFETAGPYGRGRLVTKNGTENFALKTSAPSTWLTAPIGSTTFTISNTANVTSCTLGWYSAWA
jgi:hypothetical protein